MTNNQFPIGGHCFNASTECGSLHKTGVLAGVGQTLTLTQLIETI